MGVLAESVTGFEDGLQEFIESIPVADYPRRQFSFADIKRVGKMLAEDIPEVRRQDDDVLLAFRIAHNWRMAHALPMIVERKRLGYIAQGGVVTAGRVKRMASIRKKLKRGTTDLRQMQDLGGCRAVMSNVPDLLRVVSRYLDGGQTRSDVKYVSDYLTRPKADGYRGVHLIIKFAGVGLSEDYSGQRLEVQVRTRLQHSWSTAVEVIGSVLDQDLKGGRGDQRWRDLMALMSDYYALHDGLPLRSEAPQTQAQLCRAIKDIDQEISALDLLTNLRAAMGKYVENPEASQMYMLSMNAITREVRAERRSTISIASGDDYDEIGDRKQTVIVSVDDASHLRRAFPNFYLDVAKFTTMLGRAVKNRKVEKSFRGTFSLPEISVNR